MRITGRWPSVELREVHATDTPLIEILNFRPLGRSIENYRACSISELKQAFLFIGLLGLPWRARKPRKKISQQGVRRRSQ